jgi:uncharacterized membrane protein
VGYSCRCVSQSQQGITRLWGEAATGWVLDALLCCAKICSGYRPGIDNPLAYLIVKFLHVVGAMVLFGTGVGIAFFMLMAHLSRDARLVAKIAGIVVLADFLFTATAIVAQPVTGYLLIRETGGSISEGWIIASLALYVIAGVFWLPVVWMQMRMHRLAEQAASAGAGLPAAYHRLFRWWFAFGFPGFGSVLAIIWLMVAKPSF